MIYKTIFGVFKGKYIESREGVFWLTSPIRHQGYVLLKKNGNSYDAIRMLKIRI